MPISKIHTSSLGSITDINSLSTLTLGTGGSDRLHITANGGISFGSSETAYGTSGQVLQSNGDAAPTWVTINASAGVTIGDTAPSSPSEGDQWWDSSVGRLYIYYNDGNSSQWVDASPSLVGPAGADGADGTTYTTTSNVQLGSLGIGTPASGTSGEIRATNNITAYYSSDFRLKENIKPLENPLNKLNSIRGVSFDWTEEEIQRRGGIDDYFVRKSDIGVIAQEIETVLPEAVATRPDGYKAVRYELIIPLLIECLKTQQEQINSLKKQLEEIK